MKFKNCSNCKHLETAICSVCSDSDMFFDPDFDYKKIIDHFGGNIQICKSIEEMAELSKNLIKFINPYQSDDQIIDKITEEMADVQNMINQLIVIFDNKNEMRKIMRLKTNRTLDKISH